MNLKLELLGAPGTCTFLDIASSSETNYGCSTLFKTKEALFFWNLRKSLAVSIIVKLGGYKDGFMLVIMNMGSARARNVIKKNERLVPVPVFFFLHL